MSLNNLKGESPKEIFGRNMMDYIQQRRIENIVTQIKLGVYSEGMIGELALANGAVSRSEAIEIEKEVKRLLAES